MKDTNPVGGALSSTGVRVSCAECTVSRLCFPFVLNSADAIQLNRLATQLPTLQQGELLCRAGDPSSAIYVVRSGSIKSFCISEDGEEQVMAFYFPGEVVGLDSVNQAQNENFAVALETTSVCNLPFHGLEILARKIPALQDQLFRMMSQELLQEQELIMLLNKKNTEARVTAFLLNLSARFSRRRLSPLVFRLPMPRADIANYLGMASETVSRIMSRLRVNKIIEFQRDELHILDFEALNSIAGTNCKLVPVAKNA